MLARPHRTVAQLARRYLSKNNLNIARLALLLRCFPDATAAGPQVRLLSYERFCAEPADGLDRLAAAIEAAEQEAFRTLDRDITPARPYEIDRTALPAGLVDEALALHGALCRDSLV